jgi:nucleoside-diphosphate-sugar epimerase
LLAAKINTIALFNSSIVDFEHKNLTWKFANLYGDKTLDLTGIKADTLVYTPALWHLPHNIEEFAKTGVKRIICFSSTSIEGKAKSNNQDEKDLVQRFIKSEQNVKEICSSLGIKCTIIRPTLIYGVGLDKNITNIVKFIRCFNRFPVFAGGEGKRKAVHVDDLAKSVISVMYNDKTYGKTYNLCGNEILTYHEMVGRIFDSMGLRRKIVNFNSLPKFMDLYGKLLNNKNVNSEIALRMQQDLIFSDEEAREDFGYNPRAFLKSGSHDIYPDFKRTLQDYSKFSEKIIKEEAA